MRGWHGIAFVLGQPLTGFYLGRNRIALALILRRHPRIDGCKFGGVGLGEDLLCRDRWCYDSFWHDIPSLIGMCCARGRRGSPASASSLLVGLLCHVLRAAVKRRGGAAWSELVRKW